MAAPRLIKSWADVPVSVPVSLAAAISNRHVQTIQRHCRAGILRAEKHGKDWLIPKSALMEYCGENTAWKQ